MSSFFFGFRTKEHALSLYSKTKSKIKKVFFIIDTHLTNLRLCNLKCFTSSPKAMYKHILHTIIRQFIKHVSRHLTGIIHLDEVQPYYDKKNVNNIQNVHTIQCL
jgi:hypothetical protein